MCDVAEFSNDFRILAVPYDMAGTDPFFKILAAGQIELVVIHRAADLQPIQLIGPDGEISKPRPFATQSGLWGRAERLESHARLLSTSPASPARLSTELLPLPRPTL